MVRNKKFLLKLISLVLFLEMKAIQCDTLQRKRQHVIPHYVLCTPFTKLHKLALTRIETEVGGPSLQLSVKVSSLKNIKNGPHETSVNSSTEEATPGCWTSR